MAHDGEGTIYIPLAEFWEFVQKYAPGDGSAEISFGVPRVEDGGEDLMISYAFSTECPPSDWSKKPKAVTEWAELRAKKST